MPSPGGAGPTIARRFFVDPYRPQLLYVQGSDGIYRSDDGGGAWMLDTSLDGALTASGTYPYSVMGTGNGDEAVLRDMQFDAARPQLRFACGVAGVFMATDGQTWHPLLRSVDMAIQPTSICYDPAACERAIYVGTSNRGLLRISPIPPDWDYPVGSLQVAVGRITLLRVHDVGTGFGPPYDFLDAEVIVCLESEPEKAFGLRLRDDPNRAEGEGTLRILRDCFNANRLVRLEFVRTGCRTATIVRVIEQP